MIKRRLVGLLGRAHLLYLAARDERTPLPAKAVALLALAWIFVPVDFDFVPLLGWADDAVVVLAGSRLVRRLTPRDLYAEFESESPRSLRRFGLAALAVGLIVTAGIVVLIWWLLFA